MSNPAPHALSVELEDRSGALARVVGMFARRGFNIETLAVRPSARAGVSDLALTVRCDDRALAQIEKQLMKLVNVLSVRAADLPSAPSPGGRTPPGRPLSERTAMATIHRHGNLDLLGGKVAVIGYGSQGHAHALNLHDSGVQVQVGLREGSASREAAEDAGLAVGSAAEATAGAQVVALLLPDHVQKDVYEREVRPNLAAGATLLFAHGFNIHFGRIEAPAGHDVVMVAPKAPGHRVRELYEAGAGTPALVAVHRDASGNALDLALAYGAGIGSARVGLLETTFAEETESDLFGEQAVLCGGVTELMRAGFETLVEAGYQPEIAYYECINELKLIVDLVYQGGFEYMRHSISDVAEYGDLSRGPTVVDGHVRENMRRVLDDIRSGVFARELIADDDAGRPRFAELRGAARGGLLEEVGRDLRDLAGTEGLLGAEAQRA